MSFIENSMKIVRIDIIYRTGSTEKITAALFSLARTEGLEAYATYGRGKALATTII